MNFPNFPYLTSDLRSKPSSTPMWNIMFKSICCRQQFQSLYVMYWVSTHNPFMPWLYAEGSFIVAWVRYENGTWRSWKGKTRLAPWFSVLLSVLKWKRTLTSAKAVAILRKGTVGTTCIIYEVDTHSSFNLWATSTQSLWHLHTEVKNSVVTNTITHKV